MYLEEIVPPFVDAVGTSFPISSIFGEENLGIMDETYKKVR